MSETAAAKGGAKDATVQAVDGPTDLDEAERVARKAEGEALGKKAAKEALDNGIKGAEAAIEKARKVGAKGEVDAALDALKRLKAERKELD